MIEVLETIYSTIQDLSGFKYNATDKYNNETDWKISFFEEDSFEKINNDFKKINIVIINSKIIPYAWETGCVLQEEDFDFDDIAYGYILGMDTFALGLIKAQEIIDDGRFGRIYIKQ